MDDKNSIVIDNSTAISMGIINHEKIDIYKRKINNCVDYVLDHYQDNKYNYQIPDLLKESLSYLVDLNTKSVYNRFISDDTKWIIYTQFNNQRHGDCYGWTDNPYPDINKSHYAYVAIRTFVHKYYYGMQNGSSYTGGKDFDYFVSCNYVNNNLHGVYRQRFDWKKREQIRIYKNGKRKKIYDIDYDGNIMDYDGNIMD